MLLARDLSSRGKLRLTGKDRVRFLNGLSTNDVARLVPGEGCHAAILNLKGRVVADLVVLASADALDLDVDPALTAKLQAVLDRYLIADDVTVEDRSAALAEAGLYGDDAARAIGVDPALAPHHHVELAGGLRAVATRELGVPGFHLLGERAAVEALVARTGAAPLAEADAEVLRVEAGVPRYGVDVDEEHLPTEARLDDAISYSKGCFLGQEVIVRLRDQGHLNWRLHGLRAAPTDGDAPLLARGTKLASPGGRADAATVTSAVRSPRFGAIALAYVHRTAWASGTALVDPGSPGRSFSVVELPFSAR